jgi:hypothetical protein
LLQLLIIIKRPNQAIAPTPLLQLLCKLSLPANLITAKGNKNKATTDCDNQLLAHTPVMLPGFRSPLQLHWMQHAALPTQLLQPAVLNAALQPKLATAVSKPSTVHPATALRK